MAASILATVKSETASNDSTAKSIIWQAFGASTSFANIAEKSLSSLSTNKKSIRSGASVRNFIRYIERGPISLEKLSIQDDIMSYTTKDGRAHEFEGLEFLALLSSHIPKPYESITR